MHFSITFLICLLSVSGFQFNRQCRSSNNFRLNDARLAVDLESLSRPELQSLAKAFGIKANAKSSDLVQQLGAIKSAGTVPTSTKPTKPTEVEVSKPPSPPPAAVPEEKVSRLQERALAKKKLVAASQTEKTANSISTTSIRNSQLQADVSSQLQSLRENEEKEMERMERLKATQVREKASLM